MLIKVYCIKENSLSVLCFPIHIGGEVRKSDLWSQCVSQDLKHNSIESITQLLIYFLSYSACSNSPEHVVSDKTQEFNAWHFLRRLSSWWAVSLTSRAFNFLPFLTFSVYLCNYGIWKKEKKSFHSIRLCEKKQHENLLHRWWPSYVGPRFQFITSSWSVQTIKRH